MRRILPVASIVFVAGCGGNTGISGESDAVTHDSVPDTPEDIGPDPACPDSDGDGYRDRACGGDDCDDTDPAVHPGAADVCLDGVDGDCDTVIDGPLVLGPDTVVVPDSLDPLGHDLVWAGSEFGLVWSDMDGSTHLTRVPADATSPADPVLLYDSDTVSDRMGVAWTGSEYALVWSRGWEPSDIHLMRVDAEGGVTGADVQLTDDPHISANPSVAWTGSELGIAWMDTRVTGSSCTMTSCFVDAFFLRASATGGRIGADTRISDETISSAQPGRAFAFWTGAGYGIVFWQWLSRLDPSGTETGPDAGLDLAEFNTPLWTGSEYGVAWYREDPSERGFYLSRLDPDGDGIDVIVLSSGERVNENASLAWTGSQYAVAWEKSGDSAPGLLVSIVDPSGAHVDLPVAGSMDHLSQRSLAWTGSELAVSWESFSTGIHLVRIGFCD
jgi:hypothetical protein